ncbi:MAG: V-type ATP synthase subunit D [Victivallales bacterium]|nr:V-type ATP synthase subunit D [Victivallales bacterium]
MPRLNVAPTKSVQLALQRDLDMATEGFTLLEQKREILVMELMRLLNRVSTVQKEYDQVRDAAYKTLRRAIAQNGYLHMRNFASGIQYNHQVTVETAVTAGFHTPRLTVSHSELHSQFGFAGTDALVDRTMQQFLQLLEVIAHVAELETTVMLLARELKKTQRRVNALEHIFIPDYKATLHYIAGNLESKELDSFFTRKMIKKKLEAARQAQNEGAASENDPTTPTKEDTRENE